MPYEVMIFGQSTTIGRVSYAKEVQHVPICYSELHRWNATTEELILRTRTRCGSVLAPKHYGSRGEFGALIKDVRFYLCKGLSALSGALWTATTSCTTQPTASEHK